MLARIWASALLVVPLGVLACSAAGEEASGGSENKVMAAGPGASSDEDGKVDILPTAPASAPDAQAPRLELSPHALANLGDSISQAFDADDSSPIDIGVLTSDPALMFHDNPQLSWIQGTDPRIKSVRSYYTAKDPALVVTPFSRSGSELVRDLGDQITQLEQSGAKPDLVYVLLGGNDICFRDPSTTADATANLYSVDQWRSEAVKGLNRLAAVLPERAVVRFVSMPRVDLLYETLASTRVPIRYSTPAGPISATTICKDLWSITASQSVGICKIVTTEKNAARRKQIGERIDAYNDALAEEVHRFDRDATLNPKHIRFQSDWHGSLGKGNAVNSSVGTYKFSPAQVSKLDCFHPSIEGQKEIADHVINKARWE